MSRGVVASDLSTSDLRGGHERELDATWTRRGGNFFKINNVKLRNYNPRSGFVSLSRYHFTKLLILNKKQ